MTPIKKTIIPDRVEPSDFNNMNTIYCCEQCTHFAKVAIRCTLEFNCQNHLREKQLAQYNTTGMMAFCRFLEID